MLQAWHAKVRLACRHHRRLPSRCWVERRLALALQPAHCRPQGAAIAVCEVRHALSLPLEERRALQRLGCGCQGLNVSLGGSHGDQHAEAGA